MAKKKEEYWRQREREGRKRRAKQREIYRGCREREFWPQVMLHSSLSRNFQLTPSGRAPASLSSGMVKLSTCRRTVSRVSSTDVIIRPSGIATVKFMSEIVAKQQKLTYSFHTYYIHTYDVLSLNQLLGSTSELETFGPALVLYICYVQSRPLAF